MSTRNRSTNHDRLHRRGTNNVLEYRSVTCVRRPVFCVSLRAVEFPPEMGYLIFVRLGLF